MELLAIHRALMRHRRLLLVGALVAVAAGVLIAGRSHTGKDTGIATAQVFVDQRRSLESTSAGQGTQTITARAILLADLMATTPARSTIAQRAGIRPEQLAVVVPATGVPTKPSPLAQAAGEADLGRLRGQPYVMTVTLDSDVPLLSISVAAPSRRLAARVAGAAAPAVSALIADRTVDPLQGLVARQLGTVHVAAVAGSAPTRILAPAVSVLLLGLWCAVLVLASGAARRWRRPALG